MSDALHADFERRYPSGTTVRAAVTQNGESPRVTVLFGPSGSGKTTILRCLAGLDIPQAGTIRFGDRVWFDAGRHVNRRPQQRGIGYLFQDYALFPHLTVAGNIGYGFTDVSGSDRARRTSELLELLDIRGLETRYPRQLSAGQQQRVALARALAPRPKLLLLDEPLSALDAPTRESLRRHLRRVLTQLKTPAVVVTHDAIEAVALADDAVILSGGRVLQSGTVQDVFSRPVDPSVAHIVGIETVEPGVVTGINEGLAVVKVGTVELLAVASGVALGPVHVCIRGEDVTLERGHAEQTSARNRLPARVLWVAPEGPLVRVGLDCGFPLTALVTRPASAQLDLREGQTVTALFKAPSIHLVGR